MKIYTKTGDKGKTSLLNNQSVMKTDCRIELLGTIDELNSLIGLAKVAAPDGMKAHLEQIQKTLIQISADVADNDKRNTRFKEEETTALEQWIDGMYNGMPEFSGFILYGSCELSARLDVARSVCRRAERRFYAVAQRFLVDKNALVYMNRLSDFLYACARYTDAHL